MEKYHKKHLMKEWCARLRLCQFQYWKTETIMKVYVLNRYWDAITADAYQRQVFRQVFTANIRPNQEIHTRSIHSVHLVLER